MRVVPSRPGPAYPLRNTYYKERKKVPGVRLTDGVLGRLVEARVGYRCPSSSHAPSEARLGAMVSTSRRDECGREGKRAGGKWMAEVE